MYKTILSLMKSYKRNCVELTSKKVALVHFFESERIKLETMLNTSERKIERRIDFNS